MTVTHLTGPALDVIHTLPDASVDAAICSPPFWNLRDYNGCEGQWGSEPTPAEFLGNLLALACEIRRVLTPHGSLVLELGDTYAGSGGAGGDYAEGGLRDGQRRFNGSAARARAHTGCPPAKSACFTPELFGASLAYGRNLLDPDMVFEPWIVRNKITWARSNPPVGALGDKFRPASSLITVACTSRTRWFDLDAVRTANPRVAETQAQHRRQPCRGGERETNDVIRQDPAGAPPLDHWWDEPDPDPDLAWLVNTQGSNLAHYAMWPPRLAERLILSMAPERVCRTCGEPSRRIVGPAEYQPSSHYRGGAHDAMSAGERVTDDAGVNQWRKGSQANTSVTRHAPTIGWSDCGHDDWRPGVVLDPFAGAGTTLAVADIHGRDAIGIDLDPSNRALYEPRYEQCWRSLGRTGASPVTEHGEQLDLLGGVA